MFYSPMEANLSGFKNLQDFLTWSVPVSFQLSINGDKEFLDNAHKVNPYHLSPVIAVAVKQSEESQEAGPLPVKVDLNKTCV